MNLTRKIKLRRAFLKACTGKTRRIQEPIIDLCKTNGHLNPAGLGSAKEFSGLSLGQGPVGFDDIADYKKADRTGRSRYGGTEYGIPGTREAVQVCHKFNQLHRGKGAVILPSGLNALTTAFEIFLHRKSKSRKPAILIPDNRYFPGERALKELRKSNPGLAIYRYPSNAGGPEIEALIKKVEKRGHRVRLIHLEAPGSQTFEIPDLKSIIAVAKKNRIGTVMDNSWASHVRFQPLRHGVDVVVQATTKYEGGYADTPSGIVVARKKNHYKALARKVRAFGTGAVAPQTCCRLFNRVASTEQRMDRHYKSALKVSKWLQQQDFVDKILCPFLPDSPDYERFQEYFKKGNGMLTVVFKENVSPAKVEKFINHLLLFRTAESWGGHVSLALQAHPERKLSNLPRGQMLRLSIGLESADDLVRDLAQAAALSHLRPMALNHFRPMAV